MAVKILINALGQHTIADVKQVTNKETEELVAYWLREPRLISYRSTEEGQINIDLGSTCPVGVTTEYAVSHHHIVSILDPTKSMLEKYLEIVDPEPSTATLEGLVEEESSEEEE